MRVHRQYDDDPVSEARRALLHSQSDDGVWDELLVLQTERGPGMVTGIMAAYLDGSSKLLDGLRDMAVTGDTTSLRDAARRLSTSSASLGALTLASLCEELEGLEQGAFDARAADLLCGIQEEFSRVKDALERELRTRRV